MVDLDQREVPLPEVQALIRRVADRGAALAQGMDAAEVMAQSTSRPFSRQRWAGASWRTSVVAVVTVAAAVVLGVVVPHVVGRQAVPAGRSGALRVVASPTSPFRPIGGGAQTGTLLCPTATVCYASEGSSNFTGSGYERTQNGGASWTSTAPLPVQALLTAPSCPTAKVCFGWANGFGKSVGPPGTLQIVETTDGGTSWRIRTMPVPPSMQQAEVNLLSCPSITFCVALVSGDPIGSPSVLSATPLSDFMVSRDQGKSWHHSASPVNLPDGLWTLHCDADGHCIGLVPSATAEAASQGLEIVRSTNHGASWTAASVSTMSGIPGGLLIACGDAEHCVILDNLESGTRLQIHTTKDAGKTWSSRPAPRAWPNLPTAISCATAHDCFVSASNAAAGGTTDAAIEATHDGGIHWSTLRLPEVDGKRLAIVYPLSCPVEAGCIGVGATPDQLAFPRPNATGAPPAGVQREIVSNL